MTSPEPPRLLNGHLTSSSSFSDPHRSRAGVGERPADELPVLAAVAPAPASARREVRLHPEGLALGGRIDARVQRGLESPYAASRSEQRPQLLEAAEDDAARGRRG